MNNRQDRYGSVLDQFVRGCEPLYSLPAVVSRLLDLDRPDAAAWQQWLECDPALMARTLRVVNGVTGERHRQVTDLTQAVATLGFPTLETLTLGFRLPSELAAGVEANALSRYWKQTLIKASAAREISRRFWRDGGEDAFLAGMMQGIGMLVLIQKLGEPYAGFLNRLHRQGGEQIRLETATLGFDHVILSARLLDDWQFPEPIVSAVAQPHNTDHLSSLGDEAGRLPRVLHLADLCTRVLLPMPGAQVDSLLAAGQRYVAIEMADVTALLHDLERQARSLDELLHVPFGDDRSFLKILSDGHRRLADLAWQAEPVATGAAPASQPASTGPSDEAQHVVVPRPPIERVAAAVSSCHRRRCPLTVLLAEITCQEGLHESRQGSEMLTLVELVQEALAEVVHESDECELLPRDGMSFSVVLQNCERQQGVAVARRLADDLALRAADQWAAELSMSAGLATVPVPSKNCPAENIMAAARRCLSAAKANGGANIKSIEVL